MAKRRQNAVYRSEQFEESNVRHLSGEVGWLPHDNQREMRYLKTVKPRSPNQSLLLQAIDDHPVTIALGPAGTGKTYLAISAAAKALEDNRIERVVLSRPAMEAGESLGFLPGTLEEKMAPYLRPLFDAFSDRVGGKRLRQMMADGIVEIAPVGYMRGRTLNNAYVVIDEAQNLTYSLLKMLLTRIGSSSRIIVNGDPDQSDLLPGMSGLADIAERLGALEGVGLVRLTNDDIVRHPLVAEMLAVL